VLAIQDGRDEESNSAFSAFEFVPIREIRVRTLRLCRFALNSLPQIKLRARPVAAKIVSFRRGTARL
jgi:hypothetical protein